MAISRNLREEGMSVDLSGFIKKLKDFYPGIEADEVFVKAISKGAQLIRNRLEAATPIRFTDLDQSKRKLWHPPGTARRNVIVYKRKGKNVWMEDAIANVSILVGYEKRNAYYMYWREYGRSGQPARPFMQGVFAATIDSAFDAATEYIKREFERRLTE